MAGTFKLEQAALARAAGPQRTAQELETLKLLQDMDEADAQRAAKTPEQRAELAAAALAAIRTRDDEAVRSAMWAGFPVRVRRMVCAIGGFDRARAEDALSKFDALERGTIWAAMCAVIRDLEKAKCCMVGGEMPKTKPVFQ